MSEIGYRVLIAALAVSIYSIVALILGGFVKRRLILMSGRVGIIIAAGLVTAAFALMLDALITHHFEIAYVATYTNNALSIPYRISALWAGTAGTVLLWTWLIAMAAALVVILNRARDNALFPYASAVVMIVLCFFLYLLLFVSNPFSKMSFIPADGIGLNPIFRNIGMIYHAPILIAGYVGFIVVFAFALAALVTGRLGNEWIITARKWALFSWILLSAGILIGMWWAYTGLGQGAYWHWDSVENATLMPWLSSSALLHSLIMQRKRGEFKVWAMLLIILTFGLVLFSTFLSRTDIIVGQTLPPAFSINTFSASPFGRLFLGFIGVSVFVSLVLVVLRRHSLASKRQIEFVVSKEGTFLLTNLLMVGAILVTFMGTLILLLNPNPRAEKASQLVPFFNQVNMPIFLAILFVAGVCGVINWRQASAQNLKRNLLRPFVAALAVGVILFVFGLRHWYPLIALVVCLLVPFTHVVEWYRGTKSRHNNLKESYPKAFLKLILADRPRYGGFIIHLSLICIAIGIIGSATLGTTKEVALMPGESMTVDSYTLVYKGLNYDATLGRETFVADLLVYDGSKLVGEYTPSIYFDINFNQQVSQAAIRSNPVQDLYIAVDGWNIGGATAISVGIYPMLMWLWIGSWLMMVGGLIAFWPEKEKVRETAGAEEQ